MKFQKRGYRSIGWPRTRHGNVRLEQTLPNPGNPWSERREGEEDIEKEEKQLERMGEKKMKEMEGEEQEKEEMLEEEIKMDGEKKKMEEEEVSVLSNFLNSYFKITVFM